MFLFPEIPEVAYEGWEKANMHSTPLFKKAIEWFENTFDNVANISDYTFKIEALGVFSHKGKELYSDCTFSNKYTVRVVCKEYYYLYKIYDITTMVTHVSDIKSYTGTKTEIIEYNHIMRGESKGVVDEVQDNMIKIDAHIRGVIASLKKHMET